MVVLSPAARLLAWCVAGTAIVYAVLARIQAGNPDGFSPIFWFLLSAYDQHGNLLLFLIAACAFALRRQPQPAAVLGFLASHPWRVAALAFALLCPAALFAYQNHPLSMDEYAPFFQARAFAAGSLAGAFPVDLVDRLVPQVFQGMFFGISRTTGEISSAYWPGFALLLTPFVWLGIPWAANPLIGALTLPAIHRLASRIAGSEEAGGWAVLLTAASPAFVISAISYYSMPAHMLCNLLYALLLLRPSVTRALLAGTVGALALVLHNPVPHLLFCTAFLAWLATRPDRLALLAALLAGYLPLSLLLGAGWNHHLAALASMPAAGAGTASMASEATSVADLLVSRIGNLVTLPGATTIQARIAGLSKVWTWASAGLLVLAAWGCRCAAARVDVRLLAAVLGISFFAYFLVPFDQGHGWGYRYLQPVWFILPVLAASGLSNVKPGNDELRNMVLWSTLLSLLLANGLRLAQVDAFIARQRQQVPPLARAVEPGRMEIVFVNTGNGSYVRDLVQNDPWLRGPRIVMVYPGRAEAANLMADRFPRYRKSADGAWGELWTAPRIPAN
jgi:hypothetical protein